MKVAILGNSITRHGFLEPVGWYGVYGMAASCKEKDYAHLLMKKFNEIEPCEFMVDNISDFELNYDQLNKNEIEFNKDRKPFVSIEESFKKIIDFGADIVIISIGENMAPINTEEKYNKLKAEFINLCKAFSKKGKAKIFVRSCFWPEPVRNKCMKEAALIAGAYYVDLEDIGSYIKYQALGDGRKFWHEGVAAHPGDLGMEEIANRIWNVVKENL